MLNNLKKDANIKEDEGDFLGGFQVLDSDIYPMHIDQAFMGTSSKGSTSITMVFKNSAGTELRQTFYVTNRNGDIFYTDKKSGEQKYLPSYTLIDNLCNLLLDKDLGDMDTDEKVVNIYDYKAKQDIPTKVPMLTALLNQNVYVAVTKEVVDKTKDDGQGNYEPTGETREQNEVRKFFHPDTKRTLTEKKGDTDAVFFDKWLKKNKGAVINKAKGSNAGGTVAGVPTQPAPAKSLFT